MKKTHLFLISIAISLVFLYSCGEEPGAAGMQANINGSEWVASTISAEVTDNSVIITGTEGSKKVSLVIDGKPNWGTNALDGYTKIVYTNGATVKTLFSGEIYLDEIDYINDVLEGSFYAVLGTDLTVKNGLFKNITFIDNSSEDELRDTLDKDTVVVYKSSVRCNVLDGSINSWAAVDHDFSTITLNSKQYIAGVATADDGSEVEMLILASATSNTAIDFVQDTNYVINYTANSVEYTVIKSGNLTISEHNILKKKIVGDFTLKLANISGSSEIDLTNGEFTIYYE